MKATNRFSEGLMPLKKIVLDVNSEIENHFKSYLVSEQTCHMDEPPIYVLRC
jgi:hypothetical protein